MTGILLIAYEIGNVIRFNIIYAEPVLASKNCPNRVVVLQRISDLALGLAYIVSVAFYLRLLSSFVFRLGDMRNAILENILTTLVLAFIALIGWFRNLGGLERLEKIAVTIKLAIISVLIFGLVMFDLEWFGSDDLLVDPNSNISTMERWQLLAGLLLIVQGFETSRYLGKSYSQKLRVQSMRVAQWIASIIYLLFVVLGLPLLLEFHGNADETAIIVLAGRIASVLPLLMVVAAVMSQFSAAVADTAGGGGLFSELSNDKFSPKAGYIFLTFSAIALIWTNNVFEIITLASRLFALYYLFQCLLVLIIDKHGLPPEASSHRPRTICHTFLILILVFVVIFAVPVD